MTEVRRQVSQPRLRVDSLLVPLRHTMNDECVSKVVDARATAADVGVMPVTRMIVRSTDPVSRVHSLLASGKKELLRICSRSSAGTKDQ